MTTVTNGQPPLAQALPVENGSYVLGPDGKPLSILEFDPHRCFPPDDNREVTLEDLQAELLPSMQRNGQLQPGIGVDHPEIPNALLALDGWRRVQVCRILGLKFKAFLLDKMPSKAELILLRHNLNNNRKGMDRVEVGAELLAYMELVSCTLSEACEAFHISEGYGSKLTAAFRRGIPPLLEAMRAREIVATGVPFIASLSPELQAQAIPMCKGKKRDTIIKIVGGLNGGGKPKAGKPLRLKLGGIEMALRNPTAEGIQSFLDAVSAGLKKLTKEGLPITLLADILK